MNDQSSGAMSNGRHYQFDYRGIRLDPYRILAVYGIRHPAQQHAIKKLLRAGNSIKDLNRDIQEVIKTLQRRQRMPAEDRRQKPRAPDSGPG